MAKSPATDAQGAVRVAVFSGGAPLGDGARLISVTVQRAVNQLPSAQLVFADGDMAEAAFPLSDQATLIPGAAIRIAAGYGDEAQTIFEGIVVKHAIRIGSDNDSRLIVECCDRAVSLSLGRRNASFAAQRDSDVIAALIVRAGLTAEVQATTVTHAGLVQYDTSDWDFLVARAEANGQLVIANGGSVSVAAPDTSAQPVLQVTWGQDLLSFDAEIDARTQLASVMACAWDLALQQQAQAKTAPQALNAQGNLDAPTLARAIGQGGLCLQAGVPMPQDALSAWAAARQLRSGLARVRGRMRFQGSAAARVGGLIEVAGVGARFSGAAFVSGLRHEIVDGDWVTEAEFGLPPDARPEPAAPSLPPGITGLQVGKIVSLAGDPAGEQRVQVCIPVLGSNAAPVWARLAQFQASSGFGAFFVPEIDDEVVLGFFGNDPAHPVVLGSLYSSRRPPPYALANDNRTQAIVTRAGLKVEFDETNKSITLTTPANNRVVLSDHDRSITLLDQNGSRVELNSDGVTIDSAKDIHVTAKGAITLDAAGGVSISSPMDVSLTGLNVRCAAQVGFTATGSATAELSASGQTVVRGALVLIN